MPRHGKPLNLRGRSVGCIHVIWSLCLQAEAKKLAFYLFYNIKGETARNHLVEEDLAAFLRPELAREAFQMLDTDGNDKVNLHVSACPPSSLRFYIYLCISLEWDVARCPLNFDTRSAGRVS